MTLHVTLSAVLLASLSGCSTPSTSDVSLSKLWKKWEPIQAPRTLDDHDWIAGTWQCTNREHQEIGVRRDYDDFVYMSVENLRPSWLAAPNPSAWLFTTWFLRPDRNGRLGETAWPGPLGYFNGVFSLGHPAQSDCFYMRRNPCNPTNEFLLKHEMVGDLLLLERVPLSRWQEELEQRCAEPTTPPNDGLPTPTDNTVGSGGGRHR